LCYSNAVSVEVTVVVAEILIYIYYTQHCIAPD
jgi:hypothetical protein